MKIKKFLKNISHILPDSIYLRIKFYFRTGRLLNLNNPDTYTEKLQWLKLFYRDPLITRCSDKYEMKNYLKSLT